MSPRRALSPNEISDRAQHFLKILVERYIREGQPVGSRTLAKDAGMDLSPATIRNVMADLEDMGLVHSPHTSAGRVPTAEGYRLFVDSLLTLKPLDRRELHSIRDKLRLQGDTNNILESASQLLSGITRLAGVVLLPRRERASLRQIDFLRLSETKILVVLVTEDEEVHNRIIHTKRAYRPSELEQAANYLNQTYCGQDLSAIRTQLYKELQETRERMTEIMATAMELAEQVVTSQASKDDCVIAGQTNLMGFDELASMERLRSLFEAFTEKHEILHLLDECMKADGIQIFIGEQSGYRLFDGCSMVTAPYQVEEKVVGVLGVIGPTRMAYERVIPVVEVTAKLVGAALKKR